LNLNTIGTTSGDLNLVPLATNDIKIGLEGNNYTLAETGTGRLSLQRKDVAGSIQFELFSNDSDRTDSNRFRLFGSGQPGGANSEWLELAYDVDAINEYALRTDQSGAGVALPLKLEVGANLDQIFLDTDGTVGLGTDTPNSKLDVIGSIESAGVGVNATNAFVNGSFEDGVADWTCTTGTCTEETAAIDNINGLISMDIDVAAAAINVKRCFTNTTAWLNKKVDVSCQVKSSIADLYLCSNNDSATTDDSGDEQCIRYPATDDFEKVVAEMGVNSGEEICIHVKSGSATDKATIDDCKVEEHVRRNSVLIETQEYTITQVQSSLTDRVGATEYNLATATITDLGSPLLVASDDPGNTRTKFTATKNVDIVISFGGASTNAVDRLEIHKNGAIIQRGAAAYTTSAAIGVSTPMQLLAGEYVTVGSNATLASLAYDATTVITATHYQQKAEISRRGFEASSIKWTNLTGCAPSLTAATFTVFNDTTCTFGLAEKVGAAVDGTAFASPPTVGDISLNIPFVPAGRYKVGFAGYGFAGTSTDCSMDLFDGTHQVGPTDFVDQYIAGGWSGIVEYETDQTEVQWQIRADRVSGASSCQIGAQTINTRRLMLLNMLMP